MKTFTFNNATLGTLKLTVPDERSEENRQALIDLGFDPKEEE